MTIHPFTESNIACAERNVSNALELLARHVACDGLDARLVVAAHAELLDAKGRLAAAAQLEELEREVASADTERPSHLTVVK